MDASADSLVLENDQALKYFRSINKRYSTEDFVVLTFKPKNGIFNEVSLNILDELAKDLKNSVNDISSVLTILDVPLLNSPKIGFKDLMKEQRTLRTKDVDLDLAKREFSTSPLYKNLLLSIDATTTVIVVNFKKDNKYFDLLKERNDLREIKITRKLTSGEKILLKESEINFKNYSTEHSAKVKENIKNIRGVVSKYKDNASMFLGGVPMITSDMTDFIAQDIQKYYPELVHTDENGFLSVKYVEMIPLLLNYNKSMKKEMKDELDKLKLLIVNK